MLRVLLKRTGSRGLQDLQGSLGLQGTLSLILPQLDLPFVPV